MHHALDRDRFALRMSLRYKAEIACVMYGTAEGYQRYSSDQRYSEVFRAVSKRHGQSDT